MGYAMRLYKSMLAIGFALAASGLSAAPIPKELKRDNDKVRILGKWKQEFLAMRGGEKQPDTSATFRFSPDGGCGITSGNATRENPSEYTLDAASTPRKMKWLNGPEKTEWRCLYELDGDSLKVCFIDHNTEVPAVLAPAANATIYYLKRIKE